MPGIISIMREFKSYRFFDCILIKICSCDAYRFFSVCQAYNVSIYELNLRLKDDKYSEYYFFVKSRDLEKLRDASIKTRISYEQIKEIGILPAVKRFLNRKFFFTCILSCAIMLYVLTLFIWQIQISGCVNRTSGEILELINEKGISFGMFKVKCDCDKIEEAIRNEFEDVLWVSASIKGTGLFIQIKENTYLNDKMAIGNEPADLTADFSGKIIDIVTRTGEALVKVDDEIEKGQILISGVEKFYNDSKEIYKTEHVYADGNVVVECSTAYTWKYNRFVKVKRPVRCRLGIELRLFDKKLFKYEPDIEKENYYKLVNNNVLVIGNDLYMPISVKKTKYYICESDKIRLSDKALRVYAEIMYKMFCIKEASKGVDIIEKNATISFDDSSCVVEAAMTYHKSCGIHTAITEASVTDSDEEDFFN